MNHSMHIAMCICQDRLITTNILSVPWCRKWLFVTFIAIHKISSHVHLKHYFYLGCNLLHLHVAVSRKEGCSVLIFQQLHIHLAVLKLLLVYFRFTVLFIKQPLLLRLRLLSI